MIPQEDTYFKDYKGTMEGMEDDDDNYYGNLTLADILADYYYL